MTLHSPMDCSMPGFPVLHYLPDLLKFMSIESVMLSNLSSTAAPFFCCLQSFPASRSFPLSQFIASDDQSIRVFSFSISLSNKYSRLITFMMDWLNLLSAQGTLKSLLQHNSSKASILQHSAFFTVQLSHPYVTTRKTRALTRWTFVGKAKSQSTSCRRNLKMLSD